TGALAQGSIPYTPRVKRVFSFASQEAETLNHLYVGDEHILLVLLREGGGFAGKILKEFGLDPKVCRREILKELDPDFQLNQSGGASVPRISAGPLEKDPKVLAYEKWWQQWMEWLRR
ncbi:MAG TPA: Clp protease N-terminal domain-containing protein, partial [Candidatus Limnocylindria bacterium]|nr:Clp protease N-terminal domain-containing protein [Candidatus Limnocylindria bacterium]